MKFRLNKHDDEISLESFLKAVNAHEDYQQIRFMIKDGLVWVNGEKEYARRRMLKAGDNVAFEDRYYIIFPHRDERDRPRERREDRNGEFFIERERRRIYDDPDRKDSYDPEKKTEKVLHHKRPLSWTEKKIKKKDKDSD